MCSLTSHLPHACLHHQPPASSPTAFCRDYWLSPPWSLFYSLTHRIFSTWQPEWSFQNMHQMILPLLKAASGLPPSWNNLWTLYHGLSRSYKLWPLPVSLTSFASSFSLCLTLGPLTFLPILKGTSLSPVSGHQILQGLLPTYLFTWLPHRCHSGHSTTNVPTTETAAPLTLIVTASIRSLSMTSPLSFPSLRFALTASSRLCVCLFILCLCRVSRQ